MPKELLTYDNAPDASCVVPTELSVSASERKAYLTVKRGLDICMASFGLVICSWLFLIIGIIVRLTSPGPMFFRHKRCGQYGKPIYIYKFRTMKHNAVDMIADFTPEQLQEWRENYKLKNDPRVTYFGKFLRKFSLDELPQLIDVLLGRISLVGPRPVTDEELEKYGENKDKFLSVKPGVTGYWQACARSNCSYECRMAMELFYVEHACLSLDIKILFWTLKSVIKGVGAL